MKRLFVKTFPIPTEVSLFLLKSLDSFFGGRGASVYLKMGTLKTKMTKYIFNKQDHKNYINVLSW